MAETSYDRLTNTPEKMRLYQQERATEAVTALALRLMDQSGVTRTELAERLGRTPGWITQLLDGERNKTLHTLSDVFWALGKSLQFSAAPLRSGGDTAQRPETPGDAITFNMDWQSSSCLGNSQFMYGSDPIAIMRPRR